MVDTAAVPMVIYIQFVREVSRLEDVSLTFTQGGSPYPEALGPISMGPKRLRDFMSITFPFGGAFPYGQYTLTASAPDQFGQFIGPISSTFTVTNSSLVGPTPTLTLTPTPTPLPQPPPSVTPANEYIYPTPQPDLPTPQVVLPTITPTPTFVPIPPP